MAWGGEYTCEQELSEERVFPRKKDIPLRSEADQDNKHKADAKICRREYVYVLKV